MSLSLLVGLLLILSAIGFALGRMTAIRRVDGDIRRLHSTPGYYGYYVALWCGLPAILLFAVWTAAQDVITDALLSAQLDDSVIADLSEVDQEFLLLDIKAVAACTTEQNGRIVPTGNGRVALSSIYMQLIQVDPLDLDELDVLRGQPCDRVAERTALRQPALYDAVSYQRSLTGNARWLLVALVAALSVGGLAYAQSRIVPSLRARNTVEGVVMVVMVVCSGIAIVTTLGIVLSLLFEALRFFAKVSPLEFFFGLQWSPQTAIRADQVGSSGAFGAIPLFAGTLLIAGIALLVSVPVGLFAAIYMSEYAGPKFRAIAKPILEILAGIPTVVFGFFALLVVAPFLRTLGIAIGLDVSAQSALAAGVVMGIMIVPFVSSLSDDIINSVPQSLRDGSYALGATSAETIRQVVLPAALPGIVGAVLLAASRAIGETMIVLMAAGLQANLTANPLEAVTTVTVQIATLLKGDQEFDSAKTLSAFALGITLFGVTLLLNVLALSIVRKYREKYD